MQATAALFRSLTMIALCVATCLCATASSARDFAISYYERPDIHRSANMERLSLTAYGRQFDLLLESNAGILATEPASQSLRHERRVSLYRGVIAGYDDSWARISDSNGQLSGAIWDGNELWLVESSDRLAEYLGPGHSRSTRETIIFRLSEVSGSMGDLVGGGGEPKPATSLATFGPQPGRILDIGLVASADFLAEHGSQANDVLLEMFNVVEGIFITQVGVQLRATQIKLLDANPAGLEATDPTALLNYFSEHKARDTELAPLGLAHLFVSRDLDDLDPPIRTVGIANLSVVCDRRYGVGVTQATHATILDALIAAHEIGHNFGAPHDAEAGSVCEVESSDHIMAPKISGSTRFSQCSIEQMQPEIVSAGCMREIPPTDLQLTTDSPPPTPVSERQTPEFEFVLSNLSNTHVAGIELNATSVGLSRLSVNMDAIDDGYCEGRAALRCIWPWFPAGASTVLKITGTAENAGPGSLEISVDSLHELDASNNSLSFDFEILPLAELLSLVTPGSAALHPGESKRFEAAVSNRGAADATDVTAYISLGPGLELTDNELRGCSTVHEPNGVVHACPIGTLGAGRSWSFGFTAAVPLEIDPVAMAQQPTSVVAVYATSAAIALSEADRSASATVTIGEQIADLEVSIDGPGLVEVGTQAAWEITVINQGPDPAESVRVFDDDPARTLPVNAVRIEASKGDCALSGANTEFDCTIERLDVGEQATITLTATPEQTGPYFWIDVASESSAPDSNPGNDNTSILVAASAGEAATPEINAAGSNTADSDDSGGGSTSLLMLLTLGALGAYRRQHALELYRRRQSDKVVA